MYFSWTAKVLTLFLSWKEDFILSDAQTAKWTCCPTAKVNSVRVRLLVCLISGVCSERNLSFCHFCSLLWKRGACCFVWPNCFSTPSWFSSSPSSSTTWPRWSSSSVATAAFLFCPFVVSSCLLFIYIFLELKLFYLLFSLLAFCFLLIFSLRIKTTEFHVHPFPAASHLIRSLMISKCDLF